MNGAHALLATLGANDVSVCFSNPGTSEMRVVAALDDAPDMRGILCLFEGVATGAADGYARLTGTPAATVLHLGPGLANGWANLHNARRAHVPVVNIVGDHATYHSRFDAPLQSNIELLADALEGWYCRTTSSDQLARDAANAVAGGFGPPRRRYPRGRRVRSSRSRRHACTSRRRVVERRQRRSRSVAPRRSSVTSRHRRDHVRASTEGPSNKTGHQIGT